MATRRRESATSIALPWERQGSRLREIFAGGRWRSVVAGAVVLTIGYGIWLSISERERVRRTHEVIANVRRATAQFREEVGRCPSSLAELAQPTRTGSRYLREVPVDGWDNPLWVRCPGRYDPDGLDVISAGPSGNFLDGDNVQ